MYHKIDREITVDVAVLFKITAFALNKTYDLYINFTHNKHSVNFKYVFLLEHLRIRLMSKKCRSVSLS